MWFIYCLDFKDLFFKFLFLLVQLRAQRKAATYTPEVIRNLPAAQIKQLTTSAIEMHVLSALQKINFATIRKRDFFHAESIASGLHDIDVTWLDLQQKGFSAISLLQLGYTQEELLLIPKQLDDMGDRTDILELYEKVFEESRQKHGDEDHRTLRLVS